MKKQQSFFLLMMVMSFSCTFAQGSYWKKITIYKPFPDSILLDTLTIPPYAWNAYQNEQELPKTCFFLNINTHVLHLDTACLSHYDSITIRWIPLGVNLSKPYFHKDTSIIQHQKNTLILLPSETPSKSKSSLLETGSVDKAGSFTRGISIGNRQDISTSSTLNLQLRGKITEDVEIDAAISDNQLPLQPEGTTQQIQQIDKMFIQLKSKRLLLTAGDIELSSRSSYFQKYNRKVQGFEFEGIAKHIFKKNDSLHYNIGASYARGKFAMMTLRPIEGNQGPYVLRGNDNELYIMVLAGTERVYLDGELLTRGQENDYIINYNTAEITFTNRVTIRSNSRIVVEFQYMDRFYGRYVIASQASYLLNKKWSFKLSTFEEKDTKNMPLEPLSDEAKAVLYAAGDSMNKAIMSGVRAVDWRSDVILYAMKDSMGYDSVFYYSTNPDSAKYLLYFTYVGEKKGNYIPAATLANGKVYKWVAPKNGVPQGSYAPIIKLVAPTKKSMVSLQSNFQLNSSIKLTMEYARSRNDKNTFSPLDDKDNQGNAMAILLHQKIKKLRLRDTTAFVENQIHAEWADANFSPIERYFPIEFERDWAVKKFSFPYQKIDLMSGLISKKISLRLRSSLLNVPTEFLASRTEFFSGWQFVHWNYFLHSAITYPLQGSNVPFLQYQHRFIWYWQKIKATLVHRGEMRWDKKNIWQDTNAFRWQEVLLSFQPKDTSKWMIKPYYKMRLDEKNIQSQFVKERHEHELGSIFSLMNFPTLQWQGQVSYHMIPSHTDSISLPQYTTLTSSYYQSFWKNFLVLSSRYENQIGRENKKEYFFVEVSPGQGTHTWIDYNNNGIKELNEFVVAQFKDQATYIKILMPTNTYINVFSSSIAGDAVLDARQLNIKQAWIKGFQNKMAIQTSNKTISTEQWKHYIPWSTLDSNVLYYSSTFREIASYKTTHGKWYVQYQYVQAKSRQNYTYGIEDQQAWQHDLSFTWFFFKTFMLENTLTLKEKNYQSEAAPMNNYQTTTRGIFSRFSYQQKSVWRTSLAFSYEQTQNALDSLQIFKNAIIFEHRHSLKSNGMISFKFSYINYRYNKDLLNSYLEYVLLEGLKKGQNFIWELMLTRRLENNIEISFMYNGRALPHESVIHTGSAQVRVLF